MSAGDPAELARRLLDGDRSALARLISWAENADAGFPDALRRIYGRVGTAWRVGITGPPGAGKSTLTNEIVGVLRGRGETVGILAVDPTSPFTGGALLGDRIRMEARTADEGVYIRSMASRAGHGGLARAAMDACDVMDAFGFDWLLLETVGVGQAEYEVVSVADSVVVVLGPGAGDGIQAMKAGLLEVADLLVVNKADLPGADQVVIDMEEAVELRGAVRWGPAGEWRVPVLPVSAAEGRGVAELLEAVLGHKGHLEAGDQPAERRAKRVQQVRRVVNERLEERLWPGGRTEEVESSLRKSLTPYDVAEEILGGLQTSAYPSAEPGGRADEGTQRSPP